MNEQDLINSQVQVKEQSFKELENQILEAAKTTTIGTIADTRIQDTEVTTPVQVIEEETKVTEDPILAELERVKGQTHGKTPQEKAAFALKLQAQRLKDQGLDIAEILGIKQEKEEIEEENEEKPLTRKDIEQLLGQSKPKEKSAVELAQEENVSDTEKELTLYYLENIIRPSGNANDDLKNAKTMVNSVRNSKIMEMQNLKPEAKSFSNASSIEIKNTTQNIQLTPEEDLFYRQSQKDGIPFTKEEIIKMTRKQ